jgi:hypothetical protein
MMRLFELLRGSQRTMQTLKNTFVGSIIFAVAFWTANVTHVAILRVFFGVQGKSTLSADVIIFGAMLGFVLTIGAFLGYAIVNLVFHALFGLVVPVTKCYADL